jgi:hypothetical protein
MIAWVTVAAFGGSPEALSSNPQRVWVSAGWDPSWLVELGAGRTLPLGEIHLVARAPIVLLPSAGGLELASGASVRRSWGGWTASGGADLWAAWARSELGAQLGIGIDLHVRPGRRVGPATIALDLGVRQGLGTRFWHSDAVDDLFGDRPSDAVGPSNGWLAAPVRRLRAGAIAGVRLTERVGVSVAGGWEGTPNRLGIAANPSIGQLPFTASATLEVSWPHD